MPRVLAIDVGTSSARAQVFEEDAEEREPARRGYPGETDPARIVWLVREAVDEAAAGQQYDAVSGSCFGHSLLPLDERGRPLTEILGWRDTRSAGSAEWLSRRVDPEAVYTRTGCHVHTSYWPAKLAWLAEQNVRASKLVGFSEYLYAQVLGRDVPMSLSLASATGLLDLHARAWDQELLGVLGVDPEQLPEISDEAADGWYPALLDGACSNLGAGCVTSDRAALNIGTSGAIRVLREGEPEPQPGLFSYFLDERHVVEGGAVSDGGNLYAWAQRTLRLEERLEPREPDGHGLTFLPQLGGERSLGWNPRASGAVAGLTFETDAHDLLQAAFEGVAYRIAEIAGGLPAVREVVATGHALLESDWWMQVFADALGRPVVVSDVAEGSARGAAVHVLERLGADPEPAPLGRRHEPDPERGKVYDAARARQRALYDELF